MPLLWSEKSAGGRRKGQLRVAGATLEHRAAKLLPAPARSSLTSLTRQRRALRWRVRLVSFFLAGVIMLGRTSILYLTGHTAGKEKEETPAREKMASRGGVDRMSESRRRAA